MNETYKDVCAQLGNLEMQREALDRDIAKVREALWAMKLAMDIAKQAEEARARGDTTNG